MKNGQYDKCKKIIWQQAVAQLEKVFFSVPLGLEKLYQLGKELHSVKSYNK